jgi:hypothetical protein
LLTLLSSRVHAGSCHKFVSVIHKRLYPLPWPRRLQTLRACKVPTFASVDPALVRPRAAAAAAAAAASSSSGAALRRPARGCSEESGRSPQADHLLSELVLRAPDYHAPTLCATLADPRVAAALKARAPRPSAAGRGAGTRQPAASGGGGCH